MKSIIEQVDDFMSSNWNNAWLGDNILKVYVRKHNRYFDGSYLYVFDVANIGTIPKKHQGKGYFKALMVKIESLGIPVFVENIHNPALATMLQKNGYTILYHGEDIHAIKYPS